MHNLCIHMPQSGHLTTTFLALLSKFIGESHVQHKDAKVKLYLLEQSNHIVELF